MMRRLGSESSYSISQTPPRKFRGSDLSNPDADDQQLAHRFRRFHGKTGGGWAFCAPGIAICGRVEEELMSCDS
jgi:hypothetical protein